MFHTKLIVYLSTIASSMFIHSRENNILVQELASRLCPYTNFCFKNATNKFYDSSEKHTPCCSRCGCGKDCWLNGDCCPDLNYIHPFENSQNDSLLGGCRTQFVKQNLNSTEKIDNNIYAFKVIDSCSNYNYNDGDNQEHKAMCEREDKMSLDDYIWVSDKVSGKIFKNLHCAACNGMANYEFWQIQTDCENILTQDLETLNALLMSDSCQILLEPPYMLRYLIAAYKCLQTFSYSRCNETGNWRDHDDVIEKACETFEWRYSPKTGTTNKNVFCFVCNENTYEAPLKCKISDVTRHVLSGVFSVLLAYDDVRAVALKYQVTLSECDVGEIKDTCMNKCRTLYCPIGRLAYYGTCKNIFIGIYNFDVAVVFYISLRFEDPAINIVSENGDNLESLGTTVYDTFHEVLGFKDAKCTCVHYSLWIDRSNQTSHNGFIFLAEVTGGSSDVCTFDFVFAQSVTVIGQTVPVKVNGKQATLLINLEKRQYDSIFAESNILVRYRCRPPGFDMFYKPKPHFRIQRTRACPLIEFEYLELHFIPAQLADKFHSIFEDMEPAKNSSKIRVCVDDYMSMMSRASREICHAAICYLLVMPFLEALLMTYFRTAAVLE